MKLVWHGQPVPNNRATRALKKELKVNPTKFMQQLQAMEKTERPAEEKLVSGPDETEEQLFVRIERLKGQWKKRG